MLQCCQELAALKADAGYSKWRFLAAAFTEGTSLEKVTCRGTNLARTGGGGGRIQFSLRKPGCVWLPGEVSPQQGSGGGKCAAAFWEPTKTHLTVKPEKIGAYVLVLTPASDHIRGLPGFSFKDCSKKGSLQHCWTRGTWGRCKSLVLLYS